MASKNWIRGVEIVLVLPATIVLAPMAGFSALGMMFAIVQDLRPGLVAVLMLLAIMLSLLVAVAGVAALWAAIVIPAPVLARRRTLRTILLVGIAGGVADSLYWLWTIDHQRGIRETSDGISAWSLWLLILAGPIIVAVRYTIQLIFINRSQK